MRKITPAQFPIFLREMTAKHEAAIRKGCLVAANLCVGLVVRRTSDMKPFPPVHTGRYKSAWRASAIYRPPVVARMWNDSPYAGIVELGVRSGRIPMPRTGKRGGPVPFRAILRWTYLKFRGEMNFDNENDAWGLAVAVQRKLAQRGMKGRHVLTDKAFIARMKALTAAEVQRALRGVR